MILPTVIDLFCGCGGFSSGLLNAGLAVRAGFDNDSRCVEVYNHNLNGHGASAHLADLSRADGQALLAAAGLKSVDVVVGGPPCQSFSVAGRRAGTADSRGRLLFEFVRLLGELAPPVFVLENVPNLRNVQSGFVYDRLLRGLRGLGYDLQCAVLLAADYGVPQMRRRLFVVGVRGRELKNFPPPASHHDPRLLAAHLGVLKAYRSTRDALDDLPDVASREAETLFNHEPTLHSPSMLTRFADLPPGKRCEKSFHTRLHPDRPGYTLRAGSGNFSPLRPIHYRYDRVLSVRESARLQGFADHFVWPDSISRLQQYRQVGNAVCPAVAEVLGQYLCAAMGWQMEPAGPLAPARPPLLAGASARRQAERQKRIRGASRPTETVARHAAGPIAGWVQLELPAGS